MGCFNLSGFYSHAPIQEGDKIGAILCIVKQGKDGCPIGATGYGYHPIMAPVYGKYNDYGGIEDIEESYTTKLFKENIGISFTDFVEINYRNNETTLNTVDNGNSCDDIPNYQNYLRRIIPITPLISTNRDNQNLTKEQIEELERCDEMLNDYFINRERNSCVQIIYEHESVLKCLHEIGKEIFQYAKSHIENEIKKIEGNYSYVDKLNEIKSTLPAEEQNEANDLLVKIKEAKFDSLKYMAKQWLSLGDCHYDEFDISLYLNNENHLQILSNTESLNAIEEIYSISHALNYCGGYFCPSKYDSQETNIEEKFKVNEIITNILKEKN